MTATYTFNVEGMHCNACALLIQEELSEAPGVQDIMIDPNAHTATVTIEHNIPAPDVARDLTSRVQEFGYTLVLP